MSICRVCGDTIALGACPTIIGGRPLCSEVCTIAFARGRDYTVELLQKDLVAAHHRIDNIISIFTSLFDSRLEKRL